MSRLSEDDLIATLFAPMAGPGGLGLRDDAALVRPEPGFDQVVTVDALIAGVHFFADDPPEAVARKALRVNLSDLAAKGARPIGFVLAIALPADWTAEWLSAFADALHHDAQSFACPLLGGDTVKTPGPLTVSITAFGAVPQGRMVHRMGARPGDALFVSGTIGDAALGLRLRMQAYLPDVERRLGPELRAALLDRYLHPQPRLGLRDALLAHAGGGMDISDGFVGDARKMLRVSGATALIELARVPLSSAVRAWVDVEPEALETAVTGGDDYEILASVPRSEAAGFESAAAIAGIAVTRVGEVFAGAAPPEFVNAQGLAVRFERESFSHF